jgi:hypothetical protein
VSRDAIEARLVELERTIADAVRLPWNRWRGLDSPYGDGFVWIGDERGVLASERPETDSSWLTAKCFTEADADLIVTAVNLLPGVIAWARDVLERHPVAVSHEACDHETPGEECTTYEVCGACTNNEYEAEWPCPEVRAVAEAIGVTE